MQLDKNVKEDQQIDRILNVIYSKSMTDRIIQLGLPENIYEQIERVAENSNRSLESVLLESLELLFGQPLQLQPEELAAFSDERLWAVVHHRIPWTYTLRLQELRHKEPLSEQETQEEQTILDLVDQYMLLRSEALLLLKERGHDVASYFK